MFLQSKNHLKLMPKYISDHTSHTALLFNWIIEHFLLHMQIFLWLLHEHTVQEMNIDVIIGEGHWSNRVYWLNVDWGSLPQWGSFPEYRLFDEWSSLLNEGSFLDGDHWASRVHWLHRSLQWIINHWLMGLLVNEVIASMGPFPEYRLFDEWWSMRSHF